MVPRDGDYLANVQTPVILPDWVTETDIDFYVDEFRASGFRGPLNWYRNIDRNWEQMAPWNDAKIHVPALFMIGDRDPVITFRGMNRLIPNMESIIPGLREKHVVPGCGHWIQREKPEEVNAVLLRFLASLS
jgi:pimeloyl-ACP methyl ester carboxylesterase